MNPYKEDGPCARLSFDRAYCKRCIGPPSVNDGYITGTGCRTGAAGSRPDARPRDNAPPHRGPPPGSPPRYAGARHETLSPRLKLSFGSAATGPL